MTALSRIKQAQKWSRKGPNACRTNQARLGTFAVSSSFVVFDWNCRLARIPPVVTLAPLATRLERQCQSSLQPTFVSKKKTRTTQPDDSAPTLPELHKTSPSLLQWSHIVLVLAYLKCVCTRVCGCSILLAASVKPTFDADMRLRVHKAGEKRAYASCFQRW